MPGKLNHAAAAWLLSISFILPGSPAFGEAPAVEEVLGVLGMDKDQIAELAPDKHVAYALNEGSADEVAVGVVWYLPAPLSRVVEQLRLDDPDLLDVDVTAHGLLTERGGTGSLGPVVLSREEALALLDAEPGDEFNLSAHELDSLKALKETLKRTAPKSIEDVVGQHYRELLFQRFIAYRRGGMHAIAPYVRAKGLDSDPSPELRQAANASAILTHYFPALQKVWLDYPKALPPGMSEVFPWVEKTVEGKPAVILRHRVNFDWNSGFLVLTREFYATHSYNSSQWITGCLPYRDGTVVFQQVRSYTDQVAGLARDVKHIVGRELLKDAMLRSFDRLCGILGQCH